MRGPELRRLRAVEADDLPLALRGYDRDTVKMLLHRFAESFDLLRHERDEARARVAELQREVGAAESALTAATGEIARMVAVSLDAQVALRHERERADRLQVALADATLAPDRRGEAQPERTPGNSTAASLPADGHRARVEHRRPLPGQTIGSAL